MPTPTPSPNHPTFMVEQTQTHVSTTDTSPPPPSLPPQNTISSSKLPFRPGKIRKLSPHYTSINNVQRVRTIPRIVAKTLSYEGEIDLAILHLRSVDPNLAQIIDLHHPPTFDSFNPPPFIALTKSIVSQKLSFKSGTSIYTRLASLCGGEAGIVPEAILALNEHQLSQIGVSSRKINYLHDLANKFQNGILSDSSIVEMDDKSLITMLSMINGIGAWSIHMFMIFSLHRPDVLPIGDLSVRKGVQLLHGLQQLPKPSQMEQLCEKWRPYRSVGSWYMWRFAEAKGTPVTGAAVVVDSSQQEPPPLFIEPISHAANLGAFAWGQ